MMADFVPIESLVFYNNKSNLTQLVTFILTVFIEKDSNCISVLELALFTTITRTGTIKGGREGGNLLVVSGNFISNAFEIKKGRGSEMVAAISFLSRSSLPALLPFGL